MALLVWTLSLFHLAAAYVVTADIASSSSNVAVEMIGKRQQPDTNGFMSQTCMDYATAANYSVIGTNTTYRAAFMAHSPNGGMFNSQQLNTATANLAKFQFDAAVNEQCGNLTTIAITGAEVNFTMGIVADLKINAAGRAVAAGWGMMAVAVLATVGVMA